MTFKDKNQTFQPPEGKFVSARAEGAYLKLEYQQSDTTAMVYLNDQGREVARCIFVPIKPLPVVTKPPIPRTRWQKFLDFMSLGW
jgi:hypothetical protein